MSTCSSSQRATGLEVGGIYRVPPGALVIGANVRSDTHPGAKEFAASIKARGVLEPITAWVDDEGNLVVYRGQRRTLAAAAVGTPDGLVPVLSSPVPRRWTGSPTSSWRTCTGPRCAPPRNATRSSSCPCSESRPHRSPNAPPSPARRWTPPSPSPPARLPGSGWTPRA